MKIKPIKPIKTEKQYQEALKLIDQLIDCEENSKEEEHLVHISILVEAYESEHYPIDPPNPIDAIMVRMENLGLKQIDVAPLFGDVTTMSKVLNGTRPLSMKTIYNLHKYLKIPYSSLISESQKYKLNASVKKKLLSNEVINNLQRNEKIQPAV